MIEHDFLGNFVRLADYIVIENAYKGTLSQIEQFVAHERQSERSRELLVTFDITCQFDPQRYLMLLPTHSQLHESFRQLLTATVKEADGITRLPRVIEEVAKDRFFHKKPELTSLETILTSDSKFQALQLELEQTLSSCFER
eukprot:Rhum_TRINITY_DN20318_c0_g1::Rhum_TRINITY_DN20318_c0_g1_i1::g.171365::m.171365